MEHGDKFTSIIDSTLCMVCGDNTGFYHLCKRHMPRRTWGERFIYRQTAQEMEEAATRVAKFAGTTAQYALTNYVDGVEDYAEDVGLLMQAIVETVEGDTRGEDDCVADHCGNWWASVEALTKTHNFLELNKGRSNLCTDHRRDFSLLRLSRLEDKTLGVRLGTTLQKLLDTWEKSNTERARARALESVHGKNIDDIVSQKIGVNQ